MSQSWTEGSPRGRLLLTFCTPNLEKKGTYPRTVIPCPNSYQDTLEASRQVFAKQIKLAVASTSGAVPDADPDLTLKCAITRPNGMTSWCEFQVIDWKEVIRPDGDEIGVFIQGSSDLPYEPETTGSKEEEIEKSKFLHLVCGGSAKTILAPATLQDLKLLCDSLFDLGYKTSIEISTHVRHPRTGKIILVELHEASYSKFIAIQKDPILLNVCGVIAVGKYY
ncbi:hypothetical protein BDZ97DRAFT_862870 [Flammula alnicola]|nr:hypothetical protein BDZ97DRAFT_862870 [Flammula alnicola]